jgi:hypothetical protein
MKHSSSLLLSLFLAVSWANAQSNRTDIYHVHFAVAAPGKAAQLGNFLKTSAPAGHALVLRHQDGAEWDYAVIQHLGTSATVTAAGTPLPANIRDIYAWHTDTFASGPAWADFVKSMGLGDDAGKTAGSVYVVSPWRAAPGHREQLEKALSTAPPAPPSVNFVLLQHVEGGPWNYLVLTRYNSWADFGASESKSVEDVARGSGGWYDVREHGVWHTDTLTDRIVP